jgi:hypothetical protein
MRPPGTRGNQARRLACRAHADRAHPLPGRRRGVPLVVRDEDLRIACRSVAKGVGALVGERVCPSRPVALSARAQRRKLIAVKSAPPRPTTRGPPGVTVSRAGRRTA